MAGVPEVRIVEVVKGLIVAAGMAVTVAQADISQAAASLAQQYRTTSDRQSEAKIARHLRNRG